MQVRLFKKRVVLVTVVAIILYFTFRSKEHHYTLKFDIKNSKAKYVWEFVADFSNMKELIPNMVDFTVLAESGNYDHWSYSIHYTEYLQYLPMLHYSNYGHFDVKPLVDSFIIWSNHSACFLTDVTCVNSKAEVHFTQRGADTACLERVTFSCPAIFTSVCQYEIDTQRKAFAVNLQKALQERSM
ncbi:uncharacterized protein [Anabrus simplex]